MHLESDQNVIWTKKHGETEDYDANKYITELSPNKATLTSSITPSLHECPGVVNAFKN